MAKETKQTVVIKTYRSVGDVLTRMKGEYKDIGVKDRSFMSLTAPEDNYSLLLARSGHNEVAETSEPSKVVTALAVSVLAKGSTPKDVNHDKAVVNQEKATISKTDDTHYKISTKFSELKSYTSTDASQPGEHLWLGLSISTGEKTIEGLTFNGKKLTADDVAEASTVGLGAGAFILWVKLERGSFGIVLGSEKGTAVVNVAVENTDETEE